MYSLKTLEQLVQRTEAVVTRLQSFDVRPGIQLPDPPVPLSLNAIEEWMEAAEESCRKPRIAESRRLLKERGLEAAAIPALVLDRPETIVQIFSRLEECPSEFHKPAVLAVGTALTKGFDDADAVVLSFTTAATELRRLEHLRSAHEWVCRLAACQTAISPNAASRIVEEAVEVGRLSDLAAKYSVRLPDFPNLEEARTVLNRFAKTADIHNKIISSEGLSEDERPSVERMNIEKATTTIERASSVLVDKKQQLEEKASSLRTELELVGGKVVGTATTISELMDVIQSLSKELSRRRRTLQSSLGKDVYKIVRAISAGPIPSPEQVPDVKLGAAIRKAIECGYEITLEPPREDQ